MRVLHIINSLATGGAEKLLLDSIPLYNAIGITAHVLLLNGHNYSFVQQLEDLNCCKIHRFEATSLYSPKHIQRISKVAKKYDIIHAHLFPTLYWVALTRIFFLKRKKVIFTEHSTHNRRQGSFIFKLTDRFIYSQYDCIVAITESVKISLLAHVPNKAKDIVVIENGVNTKIFSQAERYKKSSIDNSIRDTDFLIIQVASFRAQKDQFSSIRAMSYLPSYMKLILVGDGPLKQQCVDLVAQIGVQNRVVFLGNRVDVDSLNKTADIVLVSSNSEGFGLAAVEGMAAGKPCVASNVPGLAEVVKGAGMLFPVGDEKAIASVIQKLSDDQMFYQQTAIACSARATTYDISIMIDRYVEMYKCSLR